MALVLQRIQRPRHVVRGERRAVVEFGFGPQGKTIGQTVVGDADALCRQPVHCIGLVTRARHERGERGVHAEGARAFQNVGVKRIEGEKGAVVAAARYRFRIDAALGRVRIDVFEMRKIRRVGEIAEGRHAVTFDLLRARRRELRGGDRAGRQHERVPTGDQDRCGTLAALSASHHQMAGNAPSPYCRHVLRMAEAVPTRGALLEGIGPLRHDVEIPQQHPVERLGGGDQVLRGLGKITRSISASTAGFLMPIRLREPGWSAACELQKPRCSLPGDNNSPQDAMMMSKSHCRSRFSYCALSTVRTDTAMPTRSSEGL